jgi:hypothetical protein
VAHVAWLIDLIVVGIGLQAVLRGDRRVYHYAKIGVGIILAYVFFVATFHPFSVAWPTILANNDGRLMHAVLDALAKEIRLSVQRWVHLSVQLVTGLYNSHTRRSLLHDPFWPVFGIDLTAYLIRMYIRRNRKPVLLVET